MDIAGKTNQEIAMILDFSPRTVNKHLEQIFRKLALKIEQQLLLFRLNISINLPKNHNMLGLRYVIDVIKHNSFTCNMNFVVLLCRNEQTCRLHVALIYMPTRGLFYQKQKFNFEVKTYYENF